MQIFKKILLRIQKVPDKKKIIEIVSASISIPVLVTVLLLNISNLKKSNAEVKNPIASDNSKVTVIPVEVKFENPTTTIDTKTILPTEKPKECKKEIGKVELTSPRENEVVSSDAVTIDIYYDKDIYCPLKWSYRINEEQWSDYTDKSISLFNLSSGEKNLEVKIKNESVDNEILLKRKFEYINIKISPTISDVAVTSVITVTPTVSN